MENLVDAIDDGKIIRVREEYARREGLFILRKVEEMKEEKLSRKGKIEEERLGFDELRRPLNLRKSQVISELKDNFQWEILSARKKKGLNRKQVANAIGMTENDVKLIENGLLPKEDFVLVNKIQDFYKINLRKDGKDFSGWARYKVDLSKGIFGSEKKEEVKMERKMGMGINNDDVGVEKDSVDELELPDIELEDEN